MVTKLLNVLIILLFCIVFQAVLHFFPDIILKIAGKEIPDYTISLAVFCILITSVLIYDSFKTDQRIKLEIRNSKLQIDSISSSYENKIKELKNEIEFINNKLSRQRETLNAEYMLKLEEFKSSYEFENSHRQNQTIEEKYKSFFADIQNRHEAELMNILKSSDEGQTMLELKNRMEVLSSYFKDLSYVKFYSTNIFSDMQFHKYEDIELYSDNAYIIKYLSGLTNLKIFNYEKNIAETISILNENGFSGKLYSVGNPVLFNFFILNSIDLYIFFDAGYIHIVNNHTLNELKKNFQKTKEYTQENFKQSEKIINRNLPF
ncbi:hypothetical protein KA977_01665 [Candidatus Dependentiae bacterium]|nr:hypothetical protein [Candidatus Dependentiae bacterium]